MKRVNALPKVFVDNKARFDISCESIRQNKKISVSGNGSENFR